MGLIAHTEHQAMPEEEEYTRMLEVEVERMQAEGEMEEGPL